MDERDLKLDLCIVSANCFDLAPKVSLISLFVNERPLFFMNSKVFSPLSLDEALLKWSPPCLIILSMSNLVFPSDKELQHYILELNNNSQ